MQQKRLQYGVTLTFRKRSFVSSGKFLSLSSGHLSLVFEIAFVADKYSRHPISFLGSQNAVVERINFIEGTTAANGIAAHEALASTHLEKS